MNAVLENPEKVWACEEYANLGDDIRFEIINGKALLSPAPELFHQRWAAQLYLAIQCHVESHKLGEVLFAPLDVVLDERNVVQPDLVFVSNANAGLLERRGVMGAPDLVVEILSAQSLRRDRYEKRDLYARFGVKEFWLADVANCSIEVEFPECAMRLECAELAPAFETHAAVRKRRQAGRTPNASRRCNILAAHGIAKQYLCLNLRVVVLVV